MTEVADDGSQVLEHELPVADQAPQPWYRNRILLALWALMVALLLTLIIYGIVELSRGGGETTGPTTTTSTTTPTGSSTTSTSPTTTAETTTEDTPPPESPEQTPEEAPPPANNSQAPAEPPHHHHHLHVPSTIQLPHTVITVPHGF
jgi:cytoskeletal protein RodZ